MTIKTKIFERGNDNESDYISDYGTGVKGRFKYCEAAGKVLPIDEARRLDATAQSEQKRAHANIAHGYIPDDMPETKHPMDKKYYTSKSKFRETTKKFGLVEIGTAFDNGYDPEKDSGSDRAIKERQVNEKFKEKLIWNLNKIRN